MALTAAQKQQRYRDNLKKKDLYDLHKVKHASRMKKYRQQLTGSERSKYLLNHAESQKQYMKKKNFNIEYVFLQYQEFLLYFRVTLAHQLLRYNLFRKQQKKSKGHCRKIRQKKSWWYNLLHNLLVFYHRQHINESLESFQIMTRKKYSIFMNQMIYHTKCPASVIQL